MKPRHPHDDAAPVELDGLFRQPIYSPKGGLEGLLLSVAGETAQIVLDPHDDAAPFAALRDGQQLRLEVVPAPPSPKGEAVHAVYRLQALLAVDGRRPKATPGDAAFSGKVVRLNYAKHGEPNGVVLDSGDFIHLRPGGFRAAGLRIGDAVSASGDAQPMPGGGRVIEATEVNGVAIEAKPQKPPKHGKPHPSKHPH